MSAESTKSHSVAAFIVLIVISALVAWGFGLMNGGSVSTGAPAGVLLFLVGAYAIVALGPDEDDEHA